MGIGQPGGVRRQLSASHPKSLQNLWQPPLGQLSFRKQSRKVTWQRKKQLPQMVESWQPRAEL